MKPTLDTINLETSTVSGHAPLTVGFYLHDPHVIIKEKKMWDFGDKSPPPPDSPQAYHKYDKHEKWRGGDNYLVTDIVYSIDRTTIGDVYVGHTLQKTIAIRDVLTGTSIVK